MNVTLVPYDSTWKEVYLQEAGLIRHALGIDEIHHIGSTAIPGLMAKPVIDILAVVDDIKALDRREAGKLRFCREDERGSARPPVFQKGRV